MTWRTNIHVANKSRDAKHFTGLKSLGSEKQKQTEYVAHGNQLGENCALDSEKNRNTKVRGCVFYERY
jgi:hypothetical protein